MRVHPMGLIVGILLTAPPVASSGTFATTFADGSAGESGSYMFRDLTSWIVTIDGGPRLVSTPEGSLVTHGGTSRPGPPTRPTHRPSWSLVVPRLALVFGRPGDDWSTRFASTTQHGAVTGEILASADGAPVGHVVADLDVPVLREIVTPVWRQNLDDVVVGLSPADERRLIDAQAAVPRWSGRP